jgi:hypothetical protein
MPSQAFRAAFSATMALADDLQDLTDIPLNSCVGGWSSLAAHPKE